MVDGRNMYVYVKNDAVNRVDPSGTGCYSTHYSNYEVYDVWCHYVALTQAAASLILFHYDKFEHAYVGCKLRQAHCSCCVTQAIARTKEFLDRFGGTVSENDVKATLYGWDWGNEGYWGKCCFLWWCWSCWKAYDCRAIVYLHASTLRNLPS